MSGENLLRIRLSSGQTRHLWATQDHDFGIEKLKQGRAPFSAEWLETTEGSMVQRSQITEVYPYLAERVPNAFDD